MANFVARFIRNLKAAYSSSETFDTMNHEMIRRVFGGSTSTAGKMVNADTVMNLSAAWGCMRILSETIGSLPLSIYKRDADGNAEKDTAHPLSYLLTVSPNRDMTSAEFREALVLNLCQSGNAYAKIERTKSGTVVSLYPIPSTRVTPKQRSTGEVFYAVAQMDGTTKEYPQSEIWHIKGFGGNGLVGLSPIGAAREAMGFAMAVEEFGARFFSQGGKPSGVVTVPQFLTAEQRKVARENLQQMLGGMGNAHKFALFEGGMKPEPWGTMPLQDMEFLLLRKFSVQDICRFYRVPPHMVADLDKATFSNIEQQSQEFVNYTLMPYFTRIEASAAKWLLSPEDARVYFLRFNAEGLLRGDSAARATLYSQLLQNGVLSRNEVRALENRNRSDEDGMDDYTIQQAMICIDDLSALTESQIAKNKTPAAPNPRAGNPADPMSSASDSADPESSDSPSKSRNGSVFVVNTTAPAPGGVKVDSPVTVNVPAAQISESVTVVLREALKEGAKAAIVEAVSESNAATIAALAKTQEAIAETTAAVVAMARESANRTENLIAENSKAVADVTTLAFERSEAAIKELARVASLPREAVFDPKTHEPIGTRVVDSLKH